MHLASQSVEFQSLPAATATVNRIPLVGPEHRFLFLPVSGRVVLGVKYRFALTTQCGLADPVGPDFDGSFWDPLTQPLPVPPQGFKTPVDNGSMVLLSSEVAEFRSSAGTGVRFRRHSGSVIASLCE